MLDHGMRKAVIFVKGIGPGAGGITSRDKGIKPEIDVIIDITPFLIMG